MSLFGDLSFEEFGTILRAANAAFGKGGPNGWTQLRMTDLGIDQHSDTFTSRNGRGKAIVLEREGELIVAFRGTDKRNDIKDYDNISIAKSYSRQFDQLLNRVAKYQDEHDLHTTFTGISLGGAVTNIIADKAAHQWGHAFRESTFVGISSPYLSNERHRDTFNIGVRNDLIYGIVPGSWNKGSKEFATENIYFYLKHHFLTDHLDDTIYAHHVGHFNMAMASLQGLTVADGDLLVDVLRSDSRIIFDQFKAVVKASELRHPGDSILTIIGEGRDDRIAGSKSAARGDRERIYGMGGDDVILARHGRDEIHGGAGKDRIDGGAGVDWMSGDGGDDRLVFDTHRDRGEGGGGNDRFLIKTVTSSGPGAATVFITDFTPGEDVLVFNQFDGNRERKGIQPLRPNVEYAVYDDSDGLSLLEQGFVNESSPGQFRPGAITIYQDEHGDTFLIINRDHDRGREFEIRFDGALGDFSGDLVL